MSFWTGPGLKRILYSFSTPRVLFFLFTYESSAPHSLQAVSESPNVFSPPFRSMNIMKQRSPDLSKIWQNTDHSLKVDLCSSLSLLHCPGGRRATFRADSEKIIFLGGTFHEINSFFKFFVCGGPCSVFRNDSHGVHSSRRGGKSKR